MTKIFSYVLVMAASLGMVNVPHAMFYEHPSLIISTYMRKEFEPFG